MIAHRRRRNVLFAWLLVAQYGCFDVDGYVGSWAVAPRSAQETGEMTEDAPGQGNAAVSGMAATGVAGTTAPPVVTQAIDVCRLARDSTQLEVTVVDPNAVVYNFADGVQFPAGRYQITYVDGCRRYDDTAAWTLHASLIASGLSPQGRGGCYLVMSNAQALEVAPGTTGVLVGEGVEPAGAFASYSECVAANRKLPPLDFTFAGGSLGIMNAGDSSGAKTPGEAVGGRSPTYRLTRADDCP